MTSKNIKPGKRILILGPPNSGKTMLFFKLTGVANSDLNLTGSSYRIERGYIKCTPSFMPGCDGDCANCPHHKKGLSPTELLDTPPLLSLFSRGLVEDELARILKNEPPDAILFVMDAKNLRRSISLFLQAAHLHIPMVVALNMIDEAENKGLVVDHEKLARRLGVPVIPTIAPEEYGIGQILKTLQSPEMPTRALEIPPAIMERFSDESGRFDWMAARSDEQVGVELNRLAFEQAMMLSLDMFRIQAPPPKGWVEKLGALASTPLWGTVIAIGILVAMYFFVGEFGATYLVDHISGDFFDPYVMPWATDLMKHVPSRFWQDAVLDPNFGLLPTGLFLAFGLVFPVLLTFYLFTGFLEDMGYFPRLSILMDRIMRPIGLNGKGLMPLLMGFSCITMAIVATRVLDTRKERIIATFLLILGLPCAPLLATMFIILGRMPWTASAALFGIILVQILLAGLLANKVLKGQLTDFIVEIPPLRLPRLEIVLTKTWRRTMAFMKEAVPLFLLASFLLFLAEKAGMLQALEHWSAPVVKGWWGLPEDSVSVFIKTFIRRENGAAELARLSAHFTGPQLVNTLLIMTLLTPCTNSTLMIFKERGTKAALGIIGAVFLWTTFMGGIVNYAFKFLGVTFGG